MYFVTNTGAVPNWKRRVTWVFKLYWGTSWGAGMTQRWGRSPPTNVTGVLFQCNEFVAGQSSCSEGFSPGSPVFLPPQNPTSPDARGPAWKLTKADVASSLNISILFSTNDRRVSRGQKSSNACFKVDIEARGWPLARGDNRLSSRWFRMSNLTIS